jgi:hypothetical protein
MSPSPIQSEVTRSYNSFSGSDIRAYIGPQPFAEIQAVSYSVSREKAPIYTMGSADPRSFSRNKRGIAGSLIWVNFDRHGLLDVFRKLAATFVANSDDVRPQYAMVGSTFLGQTALFNSGLVREGSAIPIDATVDQGNVATNATAGWKELATPWYSDQILPFDITLSACNENGACSGMKLYGVEILNEGAGVSIDDAVQEMQATFVARSVEPWQAVVSPFNAALQGQ